MLVVLYSDVPDSSLPLGQLRLRSTEYVEYITQFTTRILDNTLEQALVSAEQKLEIRERYNYESGLPCYQCYEHSAL